MRAPPGARVARLQSSAARAPRVAHHRSPPAGTARRAHRGRPARAGERSSTLAAGLPADRLGPLAGFETLDDRIEPLGLDLLAEVRAVTVDVADAVDHDIPRLPSLRGPAQVVIDRDAIAVRALDLGAHGDARGVRIDLVGIDLEALGREVHQGAAIVVEQRLIEGVDEALALLGSRGAPVPAEPQGGQCNCRVSHFFDSTLFRLSSPRLWLSPPLLA